jgi:hypothetical protein
MERPKLKVLLMSDFPGGMLVLNEGWHYLMKPFVPSITVSSRATPAQVHTEYATNYQPWKDFASSSPTSRNAARCVNQECVGGLRT